MDTTANDIITAPIGEFCRLSGIGRTRVYELLGDGTLASITVGKRRLIVLESYRSLIERQRSTPTRAQTPGANPSPRAAEKRLAVDTRRQRRLAGGTRAT